jgi:UDP-N-acetylenolpyruvoylglucosamine reductase
MRVDRDVLLGPRTTLGVGGPARRLARVTTLDELREALALAEPRSSAAEPVLVLGGGSNLVVGDAGFAGLVIELALPGVTIAPDGDHAIVTAGAGVAWDAFVAEVIAAGLSGVECLSGIPGLVGATPIQNVGAYGQEVADTITRVRDTIIELRRGKGMVVDPDDPDSRSAGSFFTNPIVDAAQLAALEARLPPGTTMPRFPAPDGRTKLAAAWLIERAGFTKGYTTGNVGISRKHALALVNRGGATATELLALARAIQTGVRDRLGVELAPEPVIVGV